MRPFVPQWPIVTMPSANRFPVGWMNLPSPIGIGLLKVPVMTPVAVGLIGGYTTFSTLAWEGFFLGRTGRAGIALVYISVSVVGGLVAAWSGYSLGRTFR